MCCGLNLFSNEQIVVLLASLEQQISVADKIFCADHHIRIFDLLFIQLQGFSCRALRNSPLLGSTLLCSHKREEVST